MRSNSVKNTLSGTKSLELIDGLEPNLRIYINRKCKYIYIYSDPGMIFEVTGDINY